MNIARPPGLLAGFHVSNAHEDVPELVHAGEQWAPRTFFIKNHHHQQWELYLQASGESIWNAGGVDYRVPANGLFLAPPGIEHGMLDRPDSKHHFFYAAIDIPPILQRLPGMPEHWSRREVIFVEDAASLTAPFRQLIREVSLELPYRAAGIRAALDALIIETSRLLDARERSPGHSAHYAHPSVTHAKQLLEQHPGREWKVSDLARIVGLSASHLAESFTRDVGVSPHQYLLERRIAAAEELLKLTDLSITEIALELGFSSGQYFATVFRRLRDITPRAWRSRAK